MRWFTPVLLVACGPVAPSASTKVTPTVLAGDASQLRRLMRGSVVNGGLQFDDAACAQAFGTPGEIAAAHFDRFASCLATLELQPGAREDSLGDVLVMQH